MTLEQQEETGVLYAVPLDCQLGSLGRVLLGKGKPWAAEGWARFAPPDLWLESSFQNPPLVLTLSLSPSLSLFSLAYFAWIL